MYGYWGSDICFLDITLYKEIKCGGARELAAQSIHGNRKEGTKRKRKRVREERERERGRERERETWEEV